MPGSLRLGKIVGIRIEVHISWLIIFVLLTVSLAVGWFPSTVSHLSEGLAFVLGAIGALLLFASVLAHELAHALIAQARGLPVKSITLFVFGGVSNIEREPRSAGVEFQMALVGPLASLLIGGIAWPLGEFLTPASPELGALLSYLGISNVLLGGFNLIPGFPLDGGRVLRAAIWQATDNLQIATRWATRIGAVVAYLFIFSGITIVFYVDLIQGLWIGFIGWFLLTAAHAESRQVELAAVLKGVTVGEIMTPAPESVLPDVSVQQLVDEHLLPRGVRAVPVVVHGELAGLITLRDIQRVPREAWTRVLVGQAMIPRDALHVAQRSQPVEQVLPLLVGHDVNQLPVVEDGHLIGLLSREAIVRWLEVRRSLGTAAAARRVPSQPERKDDAEPQAPPAGTLSGSHG